jgi:hypothetical protein
MATVCFVTFVVTRSFSLIAVKSLISENKYDQQQNLRLAWHLKSSKANRPECIENCVIISAVRVVSASGGDDGAGFPTFSSSGSKLETRSLIFRYRALTSLR